MASPQKENGHVQIANELYDVILQCNFTLRELKIIYSVIRFTYGFNRKEAELSSRFISKGTGITHQHISECLKVLRDKNVLEFLAEASDNKGRIIKLNKDYDTWIVKGISRSRKGDSSQKGNSSQKSAGSVTETVTGGVTEKVAAGVTEKGTKKDNNKNINKDNLNTYALRKQNFINEVHDYKNLYPENILEDFMDYWLEPNQSKTKMKFELEKTFDAGLRLKKWARNAGQWERNKSPGFSNGNNFNSHSCKPPELKLIYDRK